MPVDHIIYEMEALNEPFAIYELFEEYEMGVGCLVGEGETAIKNLLSVSVRPANCHSKMWNSMGLRVSEKYDRPKIVSMGRFSKALMGY